MSIYILDPAKSAKSGTVSAVVTVNTPAHLSVQTTADVQFDWSSPAGYIHDLHVYPTAAARDAVGARSLDGYGDVMDTDGIGTQTSWLFTDVTDGTVRYCRLYYWPDTTYTNGGWVDFEYTAASIGFSFTVSGPERLAVLTSDSVTVDIADANTAGATYDVLIGTAIGQSEFGNVTGALSTAFPMTLNNIPQDGSTMYVQIIKRVGGDTTERSIEITARLPPVTDVGPGINGITGTTSSSLYVDDATGSDSNAGTAIGSPKKTIQAAIDIATAGTHVWVKCGNYGAQKILTKANGTKNNPIIIEGYTSTIGDSPEEPNFDHTYSVNPSKFPVLDFGNRLSSTDHHGIIINHDYVRVKCFQVTNFTHGVSEAQTVASEIVNVYCKSIGDYEYHPPGPAGYRGIGIVTTGTYTKVWGCNVVNACGEGISVGGLRNEVGYCKVYCNEALEPLNNIGGTPTKDQGTDYYFIVLGDYHHVHNCYEERVGDLGHGGHGFRLHGQYCLVEDCLGVHMKNNAFGVQYANAQHNTFRRCTAIGSGTTGLAQISNANTGISGGNGSAIAIMAGADNNTFEDIAAIDCYAVLSYIPSGSQGPVSNSVFRNFTVTNCTAGIQFVGNEFVSNQLWDNWTVDGALRFFYIWGSGKMGPGNRLTNSTLTNITTKLLGPVSSYQLDSAIGSSINAPHALP